jgi:hypothetical protein
MNYEAFTNDSLTMMYEGIRGALAADDALKGQGEEPRFRVRGTPDWKLHASELEHDAFRFAHSLNFENSWRIRRV